jgi:hypothetical protein
VIEMANIVLQEQLEWLPESVLRQLIAPAKNDDADILMDIELN